MSDTVHAVRSRAGTVHVVSPAPRDVWRRAMQSDPHAVVTQDPDWVDCLCSRSRAVDASRLYVLPSGRQVVLPLVGRSVGGARVAEQSWPYGWGHGGPVVVEGQLTVDDATVVLDDLARRPTIRTDLVPMPLTGPVWDEALAASPPGRSAERVPYLAQSVDLEGGFSAVFDHRYRKQARRWVRRAQKLPLDIARHHGGAGVDDFDLLYRRSTERWAAAAGRPLALARLVARWQDRTGQLAAAAAALGDRCTIWTARWRSEPVAVLAVLDHGDHSSGWLGAMDRVLADETSAGHLLQSMAIEVACARGARWFHMGESEPGSGVERYKATFGAQPWPYRTIRFEHFPLTATERHLRSGVDRVSALRRRLGARSHESAT